MSLVDDVLHRSLHMSCPEAARIVLLNPNPMEFEEKPFEQDGQRLANLGLLDTRSEKYTDKPYQFFPGSAKSRDLDFAEPGLSVVAAHGDAWDRCAISWTRHPRAEAIRKRRRFWTGTGTRCRACFSTNRWRSSSLGRWRNWK